MPDVNPVNPWIPVIAAAIGAVGHPWRNGYAVVDRQA